METVLKYQETINGFKRSNVTNAENIINLINDIFNAQDIPSIDTLVDTQKPNSNIIQKITSTYPTPFVKIFNRYIERSKDFDISLSSGDKEDIFHYSQMFANELVELNKTLLRFLPFLFMSSVNRMNKEIIGSYAKEELNEALSIYETIYHSGEGKGVEYEELNLIMTLLKVFRIINEKKLIGDEFILYPLIENNKDINTIFPNRFENLFNFLFEININCISDYVSNNTPDTIKGLLNLIELCFYDILNTLLPITESFVMAYIYEINVKMTYHKLATGIVLSGENIATEKFLLEKVIRSDLDSLASDNLYFINRGKIYQKINPEKNLLLPKDYINLTPFMLYTVLGTKGNIAEKKPMISEQKELFLFRSANKSFNYLVFQEFTGKQSIRLEKNSKVFIPHLEDLFDKYELLYTNLKNIIENSSILNKNAIALDMQVASNFIYEKSWHLSKEHIANLIDFNDYDSSGRLVNLSSYVGDISKFNEMVFVWPSETETFVKFFTSTSRGMLVAGKSGMGKSFLLVYYFISNRRDGKITYFINARKLENPNIKGYIEDFFLKRINPLLTFPSVNEILVRENIEIHIFIDGINEYNGPGGARALLKEIIHLIEDDNIFKNVKVVASLRNETWIMFKESEDLNSQTEVLSSRHFFTENGDAIIIKGFENEEKRAMLYEAYQKYYQLIPEDYTSLNRPMKELIKQPLIMNLIGFIYNNKPDESEIDKHVKKKIPKTLNFFILFKLLTDKKIEDGKKLINREANKNFEIDFYNCLYSLAKYIFQKITSAEQNNIFFEDKTDSIPYSIIVNESSFQDFICEYSKENKTSLLDIIIQLGLVDKILINEVDAWGNKKQGRALKFFHDQYTQFWLSEFYNQEQLGITSSDILIKDHNKLAALINNIVWIIESSKNSPVLTGALDHWFFKNMYQGSLEVKDYLMVIFNKLVEQKSGIYKYYVGNFLFGLLEKNTVSSSDLLNQIFNKGTFHLRKCLVDYILSLDFDVDPVIIKEIIENCDEKEDDEIIREMADIYADLFRSYPVEVISFLEKIFPSVDSISAFLSKIVFDSHGFQKHIAFISKFLPKVILLNSTETEKMLLIKNFVIIKFQFILDAIFDVRIRTFNIKNKSKNFLLDKIKGRVYKALEDTGLNQWNEAIGNPLTDRLINNHFFADYDGVNQREMLFRFYDYAVAMHNGEDLSLEPNSKFRELIIKMINFKPNSIIGYVAVLVLGYVLNNKKDYLDEIIDEILFLDSDSSTMFLSVLADNLSKINKEDEEFGLKMLNLASKKIIPAFINKKTTTNIYYFVDIKSLDIDLYWNNYEEIFDYIYDNLQDPEMINKLNKKLPYVCYLSNIKIGEKIVRYFLSKGVYKNVLWRESILRLLAALHSRSPKLLDNIIASIELDKSMINNTEILKFLDVDMHRIRDARSYQIAWNEFFLHAFVNIKKVRYFIIKDLIGGLVQSNSVEDYAKEFRRFVVETAKGVLAKEYENLDYDFFTVDSAFKSTESKRIEGKGKIYVVPVKN